MAKVKIEGCELIENTFSQDGYSWNALTLIEASKGLEIFEIPLAGINLDVNVWSGLDSVHGFLHHSTRVKETNLDFPIILTDKGRIADGYHRICKAILEGRETIKAVRLEKMPAYDSKVTKED